MEKITRTDLFVHDMVHDNPAAVRYQSQYNAPAFLKSRGYDGKTFDLSNCAQYGLLWDGVGEFFGRRAIFPEGSEAREWVLSRKEQMQKAYRDAANCGIEVSFMMDMIVFPTAITEIFPEILNADGKIDIARPLTEKLIEKMFDEMFVEFPQIKGIYIRFGETYTGKRYGEPYHTGNNPILKTDSEEYHLLLINYLQRIVCDKHGRQIYYRTWGMWGCGDFQYDKVTYLKISDKVPVNENFYFCIKHTSGDFHRCTVFNQTLNCGKHNQIVEVQAAREYEGKGAFPDYIADGVINGFEEYKWLMQNEKTRCLRDVINVENSNVKGLWTWSRGGGWDGPYINGVNGVHGEEVVKNGSELWCDLNAYVLSAWAKDTSKSDRFFVLKYAEEVLKMNEVDRNTFYDICVLSQRAVLLGRGVNTDRYAWDPWWTRDQNINPQLFYGNIQNALNSGAENELLWEKHRSVELWREIVKLARSLKSGKNREFVKVSCEYGYYLFAIFETMFKANIYSKQGKDVNKVISLYDKLWRLWQELKKGNDCCPTLYAKADENQRLIGYEGNRGFDSVINNLRSK